MYVTIKGVSWAVQALSYVNLNAKKAFKRICRRQLSIRASLVAMAPLALLVVDPKKQDWIQSKGIFSM